MILKNKISNVNQIIQLNDDVYFTVNLEWKREKFLSSATSIYKFHKKEVIKILDDDIYYLNSFKSGFIYNGFKNQNQLKLFNIEEKGLTELNLFKKMSIGGVVSFFEEPTVILAELDEEIVRFPTHWMTSDFINFRKYPQNISQILNENYFIQKNREGTINCFQNYDAPELSWTISAQDYGRHIVYDNQTGDIVYDAENNLDMQILSDQKFIYIPLIGGQILSLYIATGKIKWYNDKLIDGGQYFLFKSILYKTNGETLFEIDADSGNVLEQFSFQDIKKGFYSGSPIWVYDDVIMLGNPSDGEVLIVDKQKKSIRGYVKIGNIGFNNNHESLIWHDKTLFLLDRGWNLHIFQ